MLPDDLAKIRENQNIAVIYGDANSDNEIATCARFFFDHGHPIKREDMAGGRVLFLFGTPVTDIELTIYGYSGIDTFLSARNLRATNKQIATQDWNFRFTDQAGTAENITFSAFMYRHKVNPDLTALGFTAYDCSLIAPPQNPTG